MILPPPAFIYLIGALILLFIPQRLRTFWMAGIAVIGLVVVDGLAYGNRWEIPFLPDLILTLVSCDELSRLVGYVFAAVSILVAIYSGSETRLSHQVATLIQMGAALGMVFAGDFISVFIFWELLMLSSLALIWHGGEEARSPGYRYALMHILGGAFLLAALGNQYAMTGSLEVGPAVPGVTTFLFIIGIGVNAAIIPLHAWLPDSYPRASVVGSVILCIFTTKGAVYLLARTLAGSEIIMYLGAIMVVYGLIFALLQDDMRRLLSYHIISQVGYMIAAIGIGTPLAINGGIAHLFNNVLYKTLLFMVVGVIIVQTGRHLLSELGGLRKQMPYTFIASIIASAAITGFPGLNGYVSKEMIIDAAAYSDLFILELLLLIGSIGTFLSFIKLNYYAFIKENNGINARDPQLSVLVPMGILSAACIFYGLYPQALYLLLPSPACCDVFSMTHAKETLIIFGAVLLNLWVARNIIRPVKSSSMEMMGVYLALGRAVLWVSKTMLPAITRIISSLATKIRWFIKLTDAQVPKGRGHHAGLLQHPSSYFSTRGSGEGLFLVSVLFGLYFILVYIR